MLASAAPSLTIYHVSSGIVACGMGCGVPRISHNSRTATCRLLAIVAIVPGRIACAMVCARAARVARAVRIIAVLTRSLPVYAEIVFRRQRQLVSELSSESDPAKRPAKISRWLRPFDIALPGRGRRGGWECACRVAGRMSMTKYGYADIIGDVMRHHFEVCRSENFGL